MGGTDLARDLRHTRPALKALLTSSYPEDTLTWDDADGEPPVLLRKPYRKAQLAEAFRSVLDTA